MEVSRDFTCIVCPLGCRISVLIENDGNITQVKGNGCKRGASYAESECVNPLRTLTSTARVIGSQFPLIPVKSDRPISKALVRDCMKEINQIRVHPPINAGDVLVKNILNTGADIVATGSVR